MNLDLFDYRGRRVIYEIGERETIERIHITVITGDEIAAVFYKDGSKATFDSGDNRIMNFYDDSYEIYNCESDDNLIDKEEFRNRVTFSWG